MLSKSWKWHNFISKTFHAWICILKQMVSLGRRWRIGIQPQLNVLENECRLWCKKVQKVGEIDVSILFKVNSSESCTNIRLRLHGHKEDAISRAVKALLILQWMGINPCLDNMVLLMFTKHSNYWSASSKAVSLRLKSAENWILRSLLRCQHQEYTAWCYPEIVKESSDFSTQSSFKYLIQHFP